MDKVIENANSSKQAEEWKPIPEYAGKYEISNWGRVKSFKLDSNGKILTPCNSGRGYYYVELWKYGKRKRCKIHRLVATAFIPNPNNLPEVNHKDENKRNNYLGNLEWCSQAYNLAYGTRVERISIPVVQLDKKGNFVSEFESLTEASKITDIAISSICNCCQHKKSFKSAGGFIFLYKDEYTARTQQDQ